MSSIDIFEPGNTVQFTIVTSVEPNSNPALTITGINSVTVVNSQTCQKSDATNYYDFVTMPNSEGYYIGEWYAEKTVVSSAYQFKKRFAFRIIETRRLDGEP